MNSEKIGKWLKIISNLSFTCLVLGFVIFMATQIFSTITDNQKLIDSSNVNAIALLIAGMGLPGIAIQIISLLDVNKKKTYTVTCKCPNCRQLIDIKIAED
ncbi:hypothetical protein B9G55_01355 [Saccharibacillus sp. O16]|nr:hypothetical protein B9G55_01355 [Saccharibacillus sp. O16]